MKIAIIAPPVTTVPPFGQGGLEMILTYKIEALTKMGHMVHLYGAGETSLSGIKFHKIFKTPLTQMKINPATTEASRKVRLESIYMTDVLLRLLEDQTHLDVIYNHTRVTELAAAPFLEKFKIPFFTIFHLPILSEHILTLQKIPQLLTVSISDDQRKDYPHLKNFVATIHNGIDPEKYIFSNQTKDFILWVGTIGFHKNPLDAIKVAERVNKKIILMGKIRDKDYYQKYIHPKIDGKKVIYLGELNYKEKIEYFRKAKVVLLQTKIREACPVTPIELTMCGTPVVAYPAGGTKELIKNGINGYLVKDVNEMTKKLKDAFNLSREKCHIYTKENFSSKKMAEKYLDIFYKIKDKTPKS